MKKNDDNKIVSKYCKMRDEILINFENMSDTKLLQKLIKLNGDNIPSSPEIARIGLHKARLYSNNVPIELKEKSKKWLLENNHSLEIY